MALVFALVGCSADRPFTTWKRYVPSDAPREHAPCEGDPVCNGEHLFLVSGCTDCHTEERPDWGPDFSGLFDTTVTLADGRTARVDEGYLRRGVSDPTSEVRVEWVGGPNMPPYTFHDAQLDWLIAYLKTR